MHVTVGVALPRWLRCAPEWMERILIALHTKFQMQRTCIGGDISETDPPRPLLREARTLTHRIKKTEASHTSGEQTEATVCC